MDFKYKGCYYELTEISESTCEVSSSQWDDKWSVEVRSYLLDINIKKDPSSSPEVWVLQGTLGHFFVSDIGPPFLHMAEPSTAAPLDSFINIFLQWHELLTPHPPHPLLLCFCSVSLTWFSPLGWWLGCPPWPSLLPLPSFTPWSHMRFPCHLGSNWSVLSLLSFEEILPSGEF